MATAAVPVVTTPGWDSLLASWLAGHKNYPEAARARGETGVVTLHFEVAADGKVLAVDIVNASGNATLDEAARGLLLNARLPSPGAPVSRTLRLRYLLEK